jgi:EAL domain-containing protein (putative c-di-GMP-specific phosphodiesterase class I)
MAISELISSEEAKISINISNLGVFNNRIIEKLKNALKDYKIAERLIIEITETSLNENFAKIAEFANVLQDLGCKVAVDDFGGGVTSFKQLREIKFDIIKIDGSFVRDITTSTYSRLVVELIVKLAKTIGAKTVAEWVETGEGAKLLLEMGVDFMQGHFFSPAQDFRSWNK